MTSWTSLPTEEAFITLRALGRVALTQGAVTANELGQYHLEVLLALTEEEGDQMIGKLAGADRVESPEVFWEGSTEVGLEYDDNREL